MNANWYKTGLELSKPTTNQTDTHRWNDNQKLR